MSGWGSPGSRSSGYPIIPCAAAGAEDMLDVIVDVDTPVYGPAGPSVQEGYGLPGTSGGPWRRADPHPPRPERLYFWFGEPIDTTRFAGHDDDTAARAVRDEVRQSVGAGIQFLHDEATDPDRALVRSDCSAARSDAPNHAGRPESPPSGLPTVHRAGTFRDTSTVTAACTRRS